MAASVLASTLVLGACLVMRVLGAKWYALHGSPDYAVVVLMVRHMLAGIDFPVFFYGQAYMGSLEPAFSALLGLFLGPTPFAVCLGTGLMAFAMIVAVHRLAWRVGGPVAAVAASALCLVGPDGYFHYMASPRGGYALGLLLTVLLLHEAVFFGVDEGDSQGVKARRFLPLGFLVGLGFWNFWLTIPAVGVVCVMLLWRLRLRLFRPSVLACGLLGFFAGSLPWWIWNARHGWQSLGATGASPGLRQSIRTAVLLFTERLPALYESPAAPGGTRLGLAALLVLLVLALGAAALPWRGDATSLRLRRLLCACFLFLGAFTAAYALSSFGAINSRRYLLPFVPVFAALAGGGIGALARAAAAAPRNRAWWLRAAAGIGILCVAFEVAGRMPDLRHHSRVKTGWHDSARALGSNPDLPGEFLADFMHYGVNWATDEEVCAVSPKLYRYAPFFERLENADNPGVLENFRGFDHFLLNTGARSDFIKLPGYRVHYNAKPPESTFGVLPSEKIASMTDPSGRDWKGELTDCNGETTAPLLPVGAGRACELLIAFKEPVAVCGLRVVNRARHAMDSWGVEGRTVGGAWRELSGMFRETGYYWSGDRFYFGGIAHRSQKAFPEAEVLELRVKMPLHRSCPGVTFETVQILTAAGPRAALDMAAAARRIQEAGIKRVFADRWHARELHRLSNGALWASRQTVETEQNVLETVRVPREADVAVAVEDAVADITREALREAGAAAEAFSVGGLTVFRLVPEPAGAEEKAVLMFYSGMLHADRAPALPKAAFGVEASFFEGGLALRGVSDFRRLDAAGSRVAIELAWEVVPGFLFPNNLAVFVHGLDESGRIVCQTDEVLSPDLNPYHERLGAAFSSRHTLSVPVAARRKPVRLELGVLELGFLPRRAWPETALAVDDCRMVLPMTLSDAAPAEARNTVKATGEEQRGSGNATTGR